MRPRLRLFGDTPFEGAEPVAQSHVTVPLSQLVDILRDAVQADRVWVDDFGDEDVQVSEDFYEILAAYRRMKDAA